MGAARDLQQLPALYTDSAWAQDFEFYGADESAPTNYDGWTATLVLAPARKAQPLAGDVYTLTTAASQITRPAAHRFGVRVPAATMSTWKPGVYVAQLRATPPGGDAQTLYVGTIQVFRGLSQVASLGGGDQAAPAPAQSARKIFAPPGAVRVVAGSAGPQGRSAKDVVIDAGALPSTASDADYMAWLTLKASTDAAAIYTAASAADRAATAADRVQTGLDRAAASASASAAAQSATDALTAVGNAIGAPLNLTAQVVAAASYILSSSDNGKLLVFTADVRVIVYVDPGLPSGFNVGLMKAGAGDVECWPARGGSAQAPNAYTRVTTQYRWELLRRLSSTLNVIDSGEAVLPAKGIDRLLFDQAAASGHVATLLA